MRIVIFVPSDVHSLELAGLTDVFAEANARAASNFYEVAIVAEDDSVVPCASGLRVLPDIAFDAYEGSPTRFSWREASEFQCRRASGSPTG
ncbi:hypothetical protein OF122_01770 [Pelagibacterium flavum]|uniref:GlxA family transcriptional regulator n=1 Tax=Pelagibacterium flavum TaxID=2984530 RepID=A0ABY6IPK5_9HYPH|nr:hypothetical protein [Pelagibacterium sp. YIM 151497]UYQ72542.1 hypothetical protein OF122_01770 [Pelagibacterium sp. YIM 151497]